VVVLLAIAAFSIYLGAQAVNFAQIQGRLVDPSGAAVAGAAVTATQVNTGVVRTVKTNADGAFSLPNLPIGPYQLSVSAKGFRDYLQKGIVLQVGETPTVNVSLQVGSVSERVEVVADAAMVETHENSISTMIDNERIMELPLNGRNAPDLIMLSGGASNTAVASQDLNSTKNYGNNQSGASQTISVGGGQENANNYLLDGSDNNDSFSNINAPFPFPDAIQEFSVQSSGLSARYGVHAGATVNAVTKSGTNQFHGSAFEFLRNPVINAKHMQFTKPVAGYRDDSQKRNQFGGTLGGPIVKNSVMFFLGYQGTRFSQTLPPVSVKLPTAAALAGDFSGMMAASCQSNGKAKTLKAGFTGNQISPTKFNAQALALLKYVPVSTDACGNYTFAVPNIWDEDQGVAKVDWTLSSRHSIFTRYFATDSRSPVTFDGKNVLLQGQSTSSSQYGRYQTFAVGDTFSINDRVVNALHLTAKRLAINRGPANNMITPATLGINVPSPIDAGMVLNVSNYFTVGGGSNMPGHFINNLLQVADDVDIVRGKHQLSFGVNWMNMRLNYLSTFQSNGQFTFSSLSSGSGDNLADFMLGLPSNFVQGNAEAENWRMTYYGMYAHDTIRLNSHLTFNVGVRWEPYLPSGDAANRGSHFDYAAFQAGTHSTVFPNAPAGLTFCGDSGVPCNFAHSKLNQFSPRLGVVWDPRGKGNETIRAGYGMFYDSPEMYYFDRYADNSPYGSAVSFTPSAAGGFTNPYTGQGSIPKFPLPFPTPGSANAYFPTNGVYINNPLDINPLTVQNWNLSIEKQFGPNWMVSASYVGSKTSHIWVAYEANPGLNVNVPANAVAGCTAGQAPSTSNTNCRRALYVANPSQGQYFSNMTSLWDGANASYNALLVTAKHRFANNFTLLSNYTWSHCISDQDFSGELTNSRPDLFVTPVTNPDYSVLRGDHGNCAFDIRHSGNVSLVASTPKLQGIKGKLLNDWQLAPLVSYRAGTPFTITTGADTAMTGATTSYKDRPNVTGNPSNGICPNGAVVGTVSCWFKTTAFTVPTAGTFGDMGRNSLTGPRALRFDASVSRKFGFGERRDLQLRLEVFNLLNHPILSNPTTAMNNANFGKIMSQSGDGRTFQGAIKFTF
jgi:hypothetical protein